MKRPRVVLLAQIEERLTQQNTLLERLCLAVERLIPPPPDTSVTIDFVEDVPDVEVDDRDESADLDERQLDYELSVMSMDEKEYADFVRQTGSDPRPKIREKMKIARNQTQE